MSSRIRDPHAEGAGITRLFWELAQMEPAEVDLQVFSDDETCQLIGLLTRLLGHINEVSE